MEKIKKILAWIFKDPITDTVSQTKLSAVVGAAFALITQLGWLSYLPEWVTKIVSVEDIKAFVLSALVAWFGIGVKNAISKSSLPPVEQVKMKEE